MFLLEVDPSVVKPGWTPLIITILLAGVITLLMISMRRQMRKIRVPYKSEIEAEAESREKSDAGPQDADSSTATDDVPDDSSTGNSGSGTSGEGRPTVNAE